MIEIVSPSYFLTMRRASSQQIHNTSCLRVDLFTLLLPLQALWEPLIVLSFSVLSTVCHYGIKPLGRVSITFLILIFENQNSLLGT